MNAVTRTSNRNHLKAVIFRWLEIILFAISLFVVIPPVPSDENLQANNYVHVGLALLTFVISRVAAKIWRNASTINSIFEILVFFLFALAMAFRFSIR